MRIKANGIHMNYELSGKGGSPVVVLSHSLGSSLVMWDPQMDLLGKDFQVLRYDTRGHGGTEAPRSPYNLDLLGEDAIALLDALKIGKAHFVGLSMGGMIAQYLGIHHADRLRSLSLCDTSALMAQEAQPLWQDRIEIARHKGLQALIDATMERWFSPSYLTRNPPMLGVIRRQFLETPVEGFVGCCEAIRGLNYFNFLVKIRTPTLILVGEDDPGTPVSASQAIHKEIAGSKLIVLSSARHLTNVEQTEAFNNALLAFLEGH